MELKRGCKKKKRKKKEKKTGQQEKRFDFALNAD